MEHKQTKIVATVGPASEKKDTLRAMALAGMNVVRLNFSHGEHAWHQGIINQVREIAEELGRPLAILADLQGPRIRTEVKKELTLEKGTRVTVSDSATPEAEAEVFLDKPGMIEGIEVGHQILIEDGTVELRVVEKQRSVVTAEAQNAGVIKNRKGVILPDSVLKLAILSEKDRTDLAFVVQEGVEYVGLSFVGSREDIETVRQEMEKVSGGGAVPKLVAKIERKEAVKNLASVVQAADAVMVARGDLGIEMPESEVAVLQKTIIRESLRTAKPVIVATQMMKSMVENPRPTRAEVSDVSNAVIDHADAVMLSEESAMGKYPVETVAMMAEIIQKTEESPFDDLYQALDLNFQNKHSMMIRSAYELSKSFRSKSILLLSMSGFTARLLSHFRPEAQVLVATDNPHTYRELALVWGVEPYLFERGDRERYIPLLIEAAKHDGKLVAGEKVTVFHGRTPDQEHMQLVGIKEVR